MFFFKLGQVRGGDSQEGSALQKVECINALGWSSALKIFLNCQFCLRKVNYISLSVD